MNKISFVFRNKIQTIDFKESKFTPNSTLLEYIRSNQKTKGTKEGCNEGDCGACTVVLIEKNDNQIKFRAINSCVMFLPSIHGKQILTIEDLGTLNKLHPIQQIFIDEHASQCGFCTPGFIMALFAQKADKINSSKSELVEAVSGNLCRCTGYQPIVNSAQEISKITDLQLFNTFLREDLIDKINKSDTIFINKDIFKFFIPFSLKEALKLKAENKNAILTSGSTDLVLKVTKRKEPIEEIIDISSIQEIQGILETKDEFIIGAGTKIEDIYQFSKENLPALSNMLAYFGAKQIRNRATIGGNIATASPIGDFLPVLFAYKAKIVISGKNERTVDVNNFVTGYRQTILNPDELIKNIIIPKFSPNQIIKSYKISKRLNLDISTVSAGFNLIVDKNNNVSDILLAFGGMAEMTKRAKKTENFMLNKEFNEENIVMASKILLTEFTPISDARSSKEARSIMAKNLLIKFYQETK
ncbi:MAG: xanthine dehydrogenase small subunit [Bacteroidales bacterium]|nr:xanthine dehydrogenase small subunit [Bacteroidales bacterium]